MKKVFSAILVLCLFVCCSAFASADYEINLAAQFVNSDFGDAAFSTFTIRDRSTGLFYIYDENLVPSETGYAYISHDINADLEGYEIYKVSQGEGINNYGYVTPKGTVMVPMNYCKLEYLSPRWQLGAYVEKCEANLADVKDWDNNTYRISYYDIYYKGSKVVTLPREGYDLAYAYGDYILVKDMSGTYTAYDKAGNISTNNYIEYSGEYVDNYNKPVIHQPTGQVAFSKECTLSSAEVKNDLYITGSNYVDLQGNILPLKNSYSSVNNFKGSYAAVELMGKYGVIDKRGNEVAPCIFDSNLRYDLDERFGLFGYASASVDGKFCFINSNGEVTYQSQYSPDIVKGYNGLIKHLQDLTGNYILLTPEGGQVAEQFSSVKSSKGYFCSAQALDGTDCVIDIFGNKILNGRADTRDFNFTINGKIIIESLKGSVQNIYIVSGDFSASESKHEIAVALSEQNAPAKDISEAESAADTPAAEPSAPQVPDSATWICPNCGAECSGKFCPNCASPRPEEKKNDTWVCPNCGTESSGKFCPNCAAPRDTVPTASENNPETGTVFFVKYADNPSLLAFVNSSDDDVYAKIFDANQNLCSNSFYVRANDIGFINVPRGEYIIRCAAGKNWVDENASFGANTGYFESIESFTFFPKEKVGFTFGGEHTTVFEISASDFVS